MKKTILVATLCLSLFALQSCGDSTTDKDKDKDKKEISSSSVPDAVKTAFTAKYPSATDIKWDDAHEDDKQTYKAKFMIGDKKMKAEFDATGGFVKESED